MKLVTKIVVSFISVILVFSLLSFGFFVITIKSSLQDNITQKTLVMVHSFESQIAQGSLTESASGVNAIFNTGVKELMRSFPGIVEINIYKIDMAKVVASSDELQIGKEADPEDLEAAKSDQVVTLFEQDQGKDIIDITMPLHLGAGIDYVIGIKSDISADVSYIWATIIRITILVFSILIGVAVFSYFLSRSIAVPIKLATKSLHEIALGEADLTVRLDDRRHDELGSMASSFNTFAGKLGEIVLSLKEEQSQLSVIAKKLGEDVRNSSLAVARIADSVDAARSNTDAQSRIALDSASSIEEIAKNIESLNTMVVDQAASVTQASRSIEEMTSSIASVFENMEQMTSKFSLVFKSIEEGKIARDETEKLMRVIAERSGSLHDANATISGIASQTNLLAMNAAIEAAHAGSAGKGFSVVAAEIRKLAESSATQSQLIQSDIGAVQSSIENVVRSTDHLGKAFDKVEVNIGDTNKLVGIVRSSLSQQREGSRQLNDLMHNLKNITSQVRSASEEMEQGNSALLSGTVEFRDAVEGMKKHISDIVLATETLKESSVNLSESAEGSNKIVKNMEASVGSFRT